MADSTSAPVDLIIQNVRLCDTDPNDLYNVACKGGVISLVERIADRKGTDLPVAKVTLDGKGLLIPALCHAHIHLDKCFLLDRCKLERGDFEEALAVTATAKAAFPDDEVDLIRRGRQLILQSVEAGVTCMRAHVEVDATVEMTCLNVGMRLKEEMKDICDIQIAAFAQDPLYEPNGQLGDNHPLLIQASLAVGLEVIGSAPYVEPDVNLAKKNIEQLFNIACQRNLHLDFHLDYNINPFKEPLIWHVLTELETRIRLGQWKANRHVCIGHATRLTLWRDAEWSRFKAYIDAGLPVSLVGLPQSDMYMMGRDTPTPPRSTLNVPLLAREYGLELAMAVNNVGNAFTPQGPPDPLALCTLGVALFQAGTTEDCIHLLESVSVNAREAMGDKSYSNPHIDELGNFYRRKPGQASILFPRVGQPADFVLLHGNRDIQSAVCNPGHDRTTIKRGMVVARRESRVWYWPGSV